MSQAHSLIKNTTLILVCKRPALHQGKQRIAATEGAEVALAIAERLLKCVLEDAENWPGAIVIAPAQRHDESWAQQQLKRKNRLILPQTSGNLGQRLNDLDNELRHQGMRNLVYIGSDSPTLSLEQLFKTSLKLQTHDIVLNRASDGGVSLWPTRSRGPHCPTYPGVPLCWKAL